MQTAQEWKKIPGKILSRGSIRILRLILRIQVKIFLAVACKHTALPEEFVCDFLCSLQGEQGEKGEEGFPGKAGPKVRYFIC